MGDLSESPSFLRSHYAAEAGICAGIGIPFYTELGLSTVVTLLSSHATPITRRFEVWRPDETLAALYFAAGLEGGSKLAEPEDHSRTILPAAAPSAAPGSPPSPRSPPAPAAPPASSTPCSPSPPHQQRPPEFRGRVLPIIATTFPARPEAASPPPLRQ